MDRPEDFSWRLTDTGEKRVRAQLGLPEGQTEVEHGVATLTSLTAKIQDADVRDYIAESVKCLECGALRACVVFLWVGAIRSVQQKILTHALVDVNNAFKSHDPKAINIKSIDDFAYMKESNVLLVAQDLGIIDKGQRQRLEEALDLRNTCGHPGKYKPGPKKVEAFVEDIIKTVLGP